MAPEQQPDPGSAAPAYPYPGPAYPVPLAPQPPKKQRQGLVFIISVVVLLGLVGGVYAVGTAMKSNSNAAEATSSPTSSPSAAAVPSDSPSPSPTPATPRFTGDLRTLLLPAPKGSRAWAKPLTKDGNLTVDQMASEYTDPVRWKNEIIAGGFERAAARQWFASNSDFVQIEIVQFDSDNDARVWRHTQSTVLEDSAADVGASWADFLKGDPNSEFMIADKADSDGSYYAAAVAYQNDILMIFEIWMNKKNQTAATALAQQQFDKIIAATT